MATGTIVTIKADRGFCFIKPTDGEDLFAHASGFVGIDFADLRVGDKVSFAVRLDPRKGTERACDVERIGATRTATPTPTEWPTARGAALDNDDNNWRAGQW